MPTTDLPELVLSFDIAVYRLTAIKKAAYKYGDRCFARIKTVTETAVEVTLKCKNQAVDIDRLADDFANEVLDQELREIISEETASIRNLLLAQAFSATSLIDQAGETADYRVDPLRIGRPDNL